MHLSDLWGEPALVLDLNKSRVGVVLDVVALNVVLQMIQRGTLTVLELKHVHLENVHLHKD